MGEGREGTTGTGGLGSDNLPLNSERVRTAAVYKACDISLVSIYSRIETWLSMEESTVVMEE